MQHQDLFHVGSHFVYTHFLRIPNFQLSIEHHVIKRALENYGGHIRTICNAIEGNSIGLPMNGTKDIGSIYRLQGVLARSRLGFVHRTEQLRPFELRSEASCVQACVLLLLQWVMNPRLCKSINLVNARYFSVGDFRPVRAVGNCSNELDKAAGVLVPS